MNANLINEQIPEELKEKVFGEWIILDWHEDGTPSEALLISNYLDRFKKCS
ncbi:hypothetical protein AB3Z07_24565 [Metabacillus halosaccharovorans]|uniref:hypothetical protein n=1 Tax=Metabacillus halosaccharovorans TaxID=930124 RepID=UPI0034CDCF1A